MIQNQFLSHHFKLSEFVVSETARSRGIDNTPSEEEVENLRRLCEGCLEPLREVLELPIVITSGYRCKALNDLLAHSSDRSQHMLGQAADFHIGPSDGSGFKFQVSGLSRRELLVTAFKLILIDPKIDYDQFILYPTFIHVSFVSKERNRHGILKAQGNAKLGYGRLTLANALSINF